MTIQNIAPVKYQTYGAFLHDDELVDVEKVELGVAVAELGKRIEVMIELLPAPCRSASSVPETCICPSVVHMKVQPLPPAGPSGP
jgi:hypothetical protein